MKHKNIIISLTLIFSLFALALPGTVRAMNPGNNANAIQQLREEKRQMLQETSSSKASIRTEIQERIEERNEERNEGLLDKLKNTIRNKIKSMIPHRFHGTLSAIDPNKKILTVTADNGESVTVFVTDKTQLKRRFGGNSTFEEFKVGDELAVIGTKHGETTESSSASENSEQAKEIDARYIRNMSIQRRNTVFVGTVTTKKDEVFTVQTVSRGLQTVHVDEDTEFVQRNTKIKFADIAVGDKVLVKGEIWDRATREIDAKKVMKLPLVPTPKAQGQSSSAASSSSSTSSSSSVSET